MSTGIDASAAATRSKPPIASSLLAIDASSALLGLLPGPKRAPDHRLKGALSDTVLVKGNQLWKWLFTAPSGEVSERVHVTSSAVHTAFRQHGESGFTAAATTDDGRGALKEFDHTSPFIIGCAVR